MVLNQRLLSMEFDERSMFSIERDINKTIVVSWSTHSTYQSMSGYNIGTSEQVIQNVQYKSMQQSDWLKDEYIETDLDETISKCKTLELVGNDSIVGMWTQNVGKKVRLEFNDGDHNVDDDNEVGDIGSCFRDNFTRKITSFSIRRSLSFHDSIEKVTTGLRCRSPLSIPSHQRIISGMGRHFEKIYSSEDIAPSTISENEEHTTSKTEVLDKKNDNSLVFDEDIYDGEIPHSTESSVFSSILASFFSTYVMIVLHKISEVIPGLKSKSLQQR